MDFFKLRKYKSIIISATNNVINFILHSGKILMIFH